MNETHRLLREYVADGSDGAFKEIVTRYLDLVYSVALRRVSGDVHRAEDVAQTVFSDLARKAASLPQNVMLGGWLHRHCCFVASTMYRTETRRQAREREAMDFLHADQNSSWDELAPVLDDAIQDLEEPDRNAITLRYFERRDLRTVGGLLGTTEDAAQKRVSRALEKLRHLLAERGVALSGIGLAAMLEANSVSAAPVDWASRIGANALESLPVKMGLLASLGALFAPAAMKVGAIALVLAGISAGVLLKRSTPIAPEGSRQEVPATSVRRESFQRRDAGVAANTPVLVSAQSVDSVADAPVNGLRLLVLSAATGQPIANGAVEFRGWEGEKFIKGRHVTDEAGACVVAFPRASVATVEITTRIPTYADTRLLWRPKQGDKIPETYTLRLDRGVPIGGSVVDQQDQPVSGAKIGFNQRESPNRATEVLSHTFNWIEVESDASGRWSVDRIAEDALRGIFGGAQHPDYVGSQTLDLSAQGDKELREGRYVFRLGNAVSVRGVVLDKDRNPVSGASVLVGPRGFVGSRETTAALDGTFETKGVKPGTNVITAQAPQFAPTTLSVVCSSNSPPVEIVLQSGRILRLRVVNKANEPIHKAGVWLDTMDRNPFGEVTSVQAEFSAKTDHEGQIFWDQAPAGELRFGVSATGYARQDGLKFQADGTEHTIVLNPGLRIKGTVRDAEKNSPIRRFKIVTGWPDTSGPGGKLAPHWSDIDRYTLSFAEGKFDYRFEEPVIYGSKEWKYIFKFTAEGYASFISRVIDGEEADVTLDVALKPSRALRITVLQPNGQPAPACDVIFATGMQHVTVTENGFERSNSAWVTDPKGEINWPADDSIMMIYAANSSGFAQVNPVDLQGKPVIELRAWGRIKGSYSKRGQPVVDAKMALDSGTGAGAMAPSLHIGQKPATDQNGGFEFDRVPAGKLRLCYLAPNGDGRSFSHLPLQEVEIKPDQTTTVNYSENGVDVVARLRWPEGFPRKTGDQVFASVHTAIPQPPPEIIDDPEAVRRWYQNPEIAAQLQTAKSWVMRETPDGSFKAEAIPMGTYSLSLHVLQPGGDNPETLSGRRTISITGDEANGVMDIGEIRLERLQPSARKHE